MNWHSKLALITPLFTLLAACTMDEEDKMSRSELDDPTRHALNTIAESRIFFAHHSVGDDLLAGLRLLADEAKVELNFLELGKDPVPTKGPVLVHARPGKNGLPKQKIDQFFSILDENASGLRPDVAMMKLCYVDIRPDTDTQDLFAFYERRFAEYLQGANATLVMQITTPLMARPTDLKSQIFRLIGKPVWEDEANEQRRQYNNFILTQLSQHPIFDLARAEATPPDISHQDAIQEQKTQSYSLWPGYTRDGGHLSELGQQVIGTAFALALADALESRRTEASASAATPQQAAAMAPSTNLPGKR
jgi:hypothetical protein